MSVQAAAWNSKGISGWMSLTGTARIRSGSRAATVRRIHSAIRRSELAAWESTWLWLAIIASGFYHGISPGMGWPLAVAAGLMDKNPRALFAALWPLSAGHLLAMLVML